MAGEFAPTASPTVAAEAVLLGASKANGDDGISKGGAIGLSTDGFSRNPGALGPNFRGVSHGGDVDGGADVRAGSDILATPTKPVTAGPADGLPGQPMSFGDGACVGAGTALVATPTRPVTAGHEGGPPEQPMSVGGGACVGDGAALVAAPNKPVAVLHAGGLTEQPMNAATLALFARAAVLGRDARAAREAEQDQAALHGRLWAELEAAEVTVEAVSVPPETLGGV